MARPPILRLAPAGVLALALLATSSAQPATTAGPTLEPVKSSASWIGGSQARVSAIDLAGEFRDKKSDRFYSRAKATVQRLESDHNGVVVLLEAKNWRGAFDKLDALAAARLGTTRGFWRDSIIKTFGYTPAELRQPFPTLNASMAYQLIVSVPGSRKRASNAAARRAAGGRTFVEPLSVGIPPGETEVGVLGCFWPDESHPMAKPFSWFVRGAMAASTLKDVGVALVGIAAGGPAGALAVFAAKQLAEEIGKSFVINTVTCSAWSGRMTLETTVPSVVGLDPDVARRELRARWLEADGDVDIVERASCDGFKVSVLGQRPGPGTRLARGKKVVISTRHCIKAGPPPAPPACDPKNPWHGSWTRVEHAGTMRVTQTNGAIQKFTWSWFGRSGEFDQLRLSGRTLRGRDPGQSNFAIIIAENAKSFSGAYTWIGKPGGGKFSAKRNSCT